jgi:tetratricopeptide (TPR) repeat protein
MSSKIPPHQTPGLQKLLQSGFMALGDGDLARAVEICREAIGLRNDMPRAHYLAALIALQSDDWKTAEQALETTVRLNERHAAAWAQLARLYATSGRIRLAEACLLNAASTERENPATRDLIGTVFRLAGNPRAALEWHQKAVDVDPGHVPFLVNLANAQLYVGEHDKARETLLEVTRLDPADAQAHWLLSRAATATSDEHVVAMRKLLDQDLPDQSVAWLEYAIGKELEDIGDWGGAFAAWESGARHRRRTVSYDEAHDIELFETLESTFTTEWLARQQSDCYDAGPVFIVGEPRTGTTLLDRMLDAHPVVTSAGELRFFGFAVRQAVGSDEPRQFSAELMRQAATADPTKIGEIYVDLTSSLRLDSAHVIDKLPPNYLYLPLILAALPNARVIHMRRDPMDSCLAIYKQLFADAYLYSYDLEELARHYARYQRLMDTWRERFGDRYIEVDYESLVGNTEETLRKVLQYIGLSWNADCLAYFERDSVVTTASAHQVREAPHQRSVGHWRDFATQLEPVARILGDGDQPPRD